MWLEKRRKGKRGKRGKKKAAMVIILVWLLASAGERRSIGLSNLLIGTWVHQY